MRGIAGPIFRPRGKKESRGKRKGKENKATIHRKRNGGKRGEKTEGNREGKKRKGEGSRFARVVLYNQVDTVVLAISLLAFVQEGVNTALGTSCLNSLDDGFLPNLY